MKASQPVVEQIPVVELHEVDDVHSNQIALVVQTEQIGGRPVSVEDHPCLVNEDRVRGEVDETTVPLLAFLTGGGETIVGDRIGDLARDEPKQPGGGIEKSAGIGRGNYEESDDLVSVDQRHAKLGANAGFKGGSLGREVYHQRFQALGPSSLRLPSFLVPLFDRARKGGLYSDPPTGNGCARHLSGCQFAVTGVPGDSDLVEDYEAVGFPRERIVDQADVREGGDHLADPGQGQGLFGRYRYPLVFGRRGASERRMNWQRNLIPGTECQPFRL